MLTFVQVEVGLKHNFRPDVWHCFSVNITHVALQEITLTDPIHCWPGAISKSMNISQNALLYPTVSGING